MSGSNSNGRRVARKSVGQRLVQALTELHDVLASGEPLENHMVVRTIEIADDPAAYNASTVKATRERLDISQSMFARLLGVSTVLVQSWEQGKRKPSRMACRLLDEINRDPQRWVRVTTRGPKVPRKAVRSRTSRKPQPATTR